MSTSTSKEIRRHAVETFNKYKLVVFIAVPIIIGISIGVSLFLTKTDTRAQRAWTKFWQANARQAEANFTNAVDKKEVVSSAIKEYNYLISDNDVSSEKVTPWVMLQLGNTHFESSNFDDALSVYNQFLEKYRNHYFTPFVKQSIGYVYEEKKEYQKAIDQFNQIDLEILQSQLNLDIGRCYEKLGLAQQAIAAYNKVIESEGGENNWTMLAQYRLDALK